MRGGSSDLRLFKNERHLIWFHLYHRQRNTGLDSLLARQNQKRKSVVFTTGSSSTCKGYKTREHDLCLKTLSSSPACFVPQAHQRQSYPVVWQPWVEPALQTLWMDDAVDSGRKHPKALFADQPV